MRASVNRSGDISSRRKPSRDGTSLIPGRVKGKLAESASSSKTLEAVVSGGGNSPMRADDPASVEGFKSRRCYFASVDTLGDSGAAILH